MDKKLLVIEETDRSGIINAYAIGGGVGTTYDIEPVLTYGHDIFFIAVREGLEELSPIHDIDSGRGYREEAEAVLIENGSDERSFGGGRFQEEARTPSPTGQAAVREEDRDHRWTPKGRRRDPKGDPPPGLADLAARVFWRTSPPFSFSGGSSRK